MFDLSKLTVDKDLANLEELDIRFTFEIIQIEKNPFCLNLDEDLQHYRLEIYVEQLWNNEEWERINKPPLQFYTTHFGEADLSVFSRRILSECKSINAASPRERYAEHRPSFVKYHDIEPTNVWAFIKALHQTSQYSKTKDFVEDYNYWINRYYNSQKFFHYLLGISDRGWNRWPYPVGESFLSLILA